MCAAMKSIRITEAPDQSAHRSRTAGGVLLNDCHSGLNETEVARVARPESLSSLTNVMAEARGRDLGVSVCGGRHAMGGQQFGRGSVAIDCRGMNRPIGLDVDRGVVETEAGMTWPELAGFLNEGPDGHRGGGGRFGWTIAQKQTGADEMTLGGALAANVHGRGLTRPPIVDDVESFLLLKPDGETVHCSRAENADLFSLAIGGYGLFGVIYSVKLRLARRRKLRREVSITEAEDLPSLFRRRIDDGFLYGDFQFAVDDASDDFLRKGVFSCYRPVDDDTPGAGEGPKLSVDAWKSLLWLAHVDKRRAFQIYSDHYRKTDGNVYWSDEHQFTVYQNGYHREIDERMGCGHSGGEMITEVYVPRDRLVDFLGAAAARLRELGGNVIYGTVRLIERDTETFLAWAREGWACVVFNLCVAHCPEGVGKARHSFEALIDLALERGGSFYLTYHRWARRDQVERAYPQFEKFLDEKERRDPERRLTSDWHRWGLEMFGR